MIYFLDGSNNPVPNGDAYAELAKIQTLMAYDKLFSALPQAEQEQAIMTATAQIDAAISDIAEDPVDANQPLLFPRTVFDIEDQKRHLTTAVYYQVVYNLNRIGNSLVNYSIGDESFTPRTEFLCREAFLRLERYFGVQ